jgi:hypothetical protein
MLYQVRHGGPLEESVVTKEVIVRDETKEQPCPVEPLGVEGTAPLRKTSMGMVFGTHTLAYHNHKILEA